MMAGRVEWTDGLDEAIDLGPCCWCGTTEGVTNIELLSYKAPEAGTGWGCMVCGLSMDGAIAVLCDECAEREGLPPRVCAGNPREGRRAPIAEVLAFGRHEHDPSRHGVRMRSCRVCGCTEVNPCEGGCWWVEPDLCSRCADQAP